MLFKEVSQWLGTFLLFYFQKCPVAANSHEMALVAPNLRNHFPPGRQIEEAILSEFQNTLPIVCDRKCGLLKDTTAT